VAAGTACAIAPANIHRHSIVTNSSQHAGLPRLLGGGLACRTNGIYGSGYCYTKMHISLHFHMGFLLYFLLFYSTLEMCTGKKE